MNCPLCNGPLKPEHDHGIEIDVCGACRGMWFDRGELEAYWSKSRPDDPFPPVEPSRFQPEPGSGPLTCPRCNTSTLPVKRIDVFSGGLCAGCAGVWLGPVQEGPSMDRMGSDRSCPDLTGDAAAIVLDLLVEWFD